MCWQVVHPIVGISLAGRPSILALLTKVVRDFMGEPPNPKQGTGKDMELSPQAKKIWEAIPPDQRLRLLNDVWCVGCMATASMGNVKGRIERGNLALTGICTRCNGVVARIVEAPE